jgi:hypothetical protein
MTRASTRASHTPRRPAIAFLSAWIVLCVSSGPREAIAKSNADAKAYGRWVSALASKRMEGRGPGTDGLVRARDLIAEHFRSAGLKPAFGESYLQAFQIDLLPGGTSAKDQALRVVDGKALRAGADFTPLPGTGSGRFDAEAVFVGYSIREHARDYDSFARAEANSLKGKVFVAIRYEPMDPNGRSRWAPAGRSPWTEAATFRHKARAARRAGASALLIVTPPCHDRTNPLKPYRRLPGRQDAEMPVLQVDLDWFLGLLGDGDKQAGRRRFDALQARADAGTDAPVPLGVRLAGELKVERRPVAAHNVAGVLPGAGDLADEVVVVGAHYDHLGYGFGTKRALHPGADDNASGTAGVMMLARWLAEGIDRNARSPRQTRPDRRTIVFVTFSGEELGLVGSAHFVGHLNDLGLDANDIALMLNMDMIGRLRNRRLTVWGTGSGDVLESWVDDATRDADLSVKTSPSGLGPSDHASFYRAKVPVLSLFTGSHRDLHRPSDTPEKINPDGAIEVLRFARALLHRATTDPNAPAYRPPVRGARAYLGVIPVDDQGRCALRQVLPSSPAARGGLMPGDVVVSIGDDPIADSSDLVEALAASKPGQRVQMVVRRGDRRLSLDVTLGGR